MAKTEHGTGTPAPLGATVLPDGINFSVYSRSALGADLLLFDAPDDPRPRLTISLDPGTNRTGHYWHVFVTGADHGQVYAWRIRGPHDPPDGHRFDGDKVLLDPYGRAVAGLGIYDRQAARTPGDNCARALRSVAVDNSRYDWEGDHPLPRPEGREIIYEMHVSGFTKSPSSGLPDHVRGTYAGLIEKIPFLKDLGITAVEFLPVHQFDTQDAPPGLVNYWGYSSISFFAPHAQYSSNRTATGPVDEFRDMVKALHRAGIRVILDVVFNHTAEGGTDGPVLSWRGLENGTYYLRSEDGTGLADFTGCGNTLNANHPVVSRMIQDSLRYWVREMHVDGFRFDLASALTRGEDGLPLANPPLLLAIDSDPLLAGTSLIAEAWDAGGLYQVGSFPGERFAQWNGPFRDDIRRFLRGDEGTIENLMARIVGSPDIFTRETDRPSGSINFVTCHDGFCLADLVAYEKKHNQANGEKNKDGSDNNLSCNHGTEGPTTDPAIEKLRGQQIRNFLCLLFLSHGSPMLLMGDEVRQSRRGNNNPWCQDNELNWFDWDLVEQNRELLLFTRQLTAFAGSLPVLTEDRFWSATSPEKPGDITWHGTRTGQPDWTPGSHCLAYTLTHASGRDSIHVILNAGTTDLEFQLPDLPRDHNWCRIIDTAEAFPRDFLPPGKAPANLTGVVQVAGNSIVVMLESPIIS